MEKLILILVAVRLILHTSGRKSGKQVYIVDQVKMTLGSIFASDMFLEVCEPFTSTPTCIYFDINTHKQIVVLSRTCFMTKPTRKLKVLLECKLN